MKLWKGIEKEGRFKGLKTLFIRGEVSFEDIDMQLCKDSDIKQLYFGAGECSDIYWNILEKTFDKYKTNKIFTCELPIQNVYLIPQHLRTGIYFILTINYIELNSISQLPWTHTQLKLQDIKSSNKFLITFNVGDGECTDMNEYKKYIYDNDEVLL